MANVDNLKFFLSTEGACSYLPDQVSASIFADPEGHMSTRVYSILIDHGFRRSSDFVYRPHCPRCQACKPARIPVGIFKPSRNQKRVLQKNKHIVATETLPELKDEHFALYQKYIQNRHAEGEMDHADPQRYYAFLYSEWCDTRFVEFRDNGKLIGVAVTDYLLNGLSALYTFFDPEYSQQSPGTFGVLWQINRARELNKKYVYLGYWIEECEKMNYKNKFQPLELYENEEWGLYKGK